VQASYPPDTYAHLVAAKDRYDPTNLFLAQPEHPPHRRSLNSPAQQWWADANCTAIAAANSSASTTSPRAS